MNNPINPELIKRINELAKKQKQSGLTSEEKEEQKKLRTEYLEIIRAQFKSTLEGVRVVNPGDAQ